MSSLKALREHTGLVLFDPLASSNSVGTACLALCVCARVRTPFLSHSVLPYTSIHPRILILSPGFLGLSPEPIHLCPCHFLLHWKLVLTPDLSAIEFMGSLMQFHSSC